MHRLAAFVAATALALAAGAAAAQNVSAEPGSGSVSLSPGFTPDPYLVKITAGGSISASNISGASCSGYIADAPDFRLNWTGKGEMNLVFSVLAQSDTTLVVNGPDGSWYCDDDSGDGDGNPLLRMSSAPGQYDIWIGSYQSGQYPTSVLSISEVSGF